MSTDITGFLDTLELEAQHNLQRTSGGRSLAAPQSGPAEPVTLFGQVVGRPTETIQLSVGASTLDIPLVDVIAIEQAHPPATPALRGGESTSERGHTANGRVGVQRLAIRGSSSVTVHRRHTANTLGVVAHLLPPIPARPVRPRRPAAPQPRNGARGVESGLPGLMSRRAARVSPPPAAGIPAGYDAIWTQGGKDGPTGNPQRAGPAHQRRGTGSARARLVLRKLPSER